MTFLADVAKGAVDALLDKVKTLIGGIPPDKLAELDMLKQKAADELAARLQELAERDRASARERHIAVRDRTPQILTYIYTAAFFLTLATVIAIGLQGFTLTPWAERTVDVFIGIMVGFVVAGKEYFLGTSFSEVGNWLKEKMK